MEIQSHCQFGAFAIQYMVTQKKSTFCDNAQKNVPENARENRCTRCKNCPSHVPSVVNHHHVCVPSKVPPHPPPCPNRRFVKTRKLDMKEGDNHNLTPSIIKRMDGWMDDPCIRYKQQFRSILATLFWGQVLQSGMRSTEASSSKRERLKAKAASRCVVLVSES